MGSISNIDPPSAAASCHHLECCIRVGDFLLSMCDELNTTYSFMVRLKGNVLDIYELRRDDYMAVSPDVKETIGSLRECIKTVRWFTSHAELNLLKNENVILKTQVDIYTHIVKLMKLERDRGLNCALTIACFRQIVQPLVLILRWIEGVKKIIYEISLMCDTISVIAASIEYEDNVKKIKT